MTDKYILQIVAEDGNVKVLTKGAYTRYEFSAVYDKPESFDQTLFEATVYFDTPEEIKELIKTHPEFNNRNVYSDGSSSPPPLIWGGLGICNTRMSTYGKFRILKVSAALQEEFTTGQHTFIKIKPL